MKKNNVTLLIIIILMSILMVVISYCAQNNSSESDDPNDVADASLIYNSVDAIDYFTSGMHFKVFRSYGGNLFIVNITKDSLAVEVLKIKK